MGNSLVTFSSALLNINTFKLNCLLSLGQREIHVCAYILHLAWQKQHLILALKLCSRGANCRCVQRVPWPMGPGPQVLSTKSLNLFWEALVQGSAFCEQKVAGDAGGSYERYHILGSAGDTELMWFGWKLITEPRLVPNMLTEALSSVSDSCLEWKQV